MKKLYFLCLTLVSLFVNAQTLWTGPKITVTKANYANWTLPANQDFLTANVILTRADTKGLFNIAQETTFDNNNYTSPIDTEWAVGTIAAGVGTLTFESWDDNNNADPNTLLNVDVVLHLITDNIYIDFKLTSWTSGQGAGGGGFTYERSTNQNLSANEFDFNKKITLFPNPTNDFIQVSGLDNKEAYSIYNILGAEVKNGTIDNQQEIDIKNFTNGLYFLKFENGNTIKFNKK